LFDVRLLDKTKFQRLAIRNEVTVLRTFKATQFRKWL